MGAITKLVLSAAVALTLSCAVVHAEGEFPTNGLTRVDVTSAVCNGWFRQASWNCKPLTIQAYVAAPEVQNKKAVVIVSHGSEGMSVLQRWYIDHLAKQGYYGIAINHWQPRGIGQAQFGYAAASLGQGGNTMNMALDVMAVAKWVRDDTRFKGYKIGHLGESMGAAVGRELNREGFIANLAASALGYVGQPLDAYAAMYMGCMERSNRDRFLNKPMLLVNGTLDDETTLEQCQKWLPWFKSRGGVAELIAMPNEYHHFDSWYAMQYFGQPQNPRECANLVDPDKGTITDDKTGNSYPATTEGFAEHRKACMKYGVTAGSRNQKPGNGFDLWTSFFDKHLPPSLPSASAATSTRSTEPSDMTHEQRTGEILRELAGGKK